MQLGPQPPAVVDNLPVVPEEKYEKLVSVLRKIYGQIGHIREGGGWQTAAGIAACMLRHALMLGDHAAAGGVYMPKDPSTKMSKGFAFVEFSNPMVRGVDAEC